jgi:ornithine cyclodeaminase/alanine dehydrogenase-like protein (mu-crystallin family)
MQFISYSDADSKLSWRAVADAIEAGHKLERADIGDLLLSQNAKSLLNRAAWIDGLGIALKSVTVCPDNPGLSPPLPSVQGAMLIFDSDTGVLKSIVDGPLVTKWKTAGDSVLGARLLANPDPEELLIIGAGTVARSLIDAYLEIFPSLKRMNIWGRTIEKVQQFISTLDDKVIQMSAISDLEKAAGTADLISAATMATEPLLLGDWVQPGTHVDLIGAYRPDMREADDTLMQKAEIFVDSRQTTIKDIGELIFPIASGVINEEHILADFYDLCNGHPGRSSTDAITVFKNGGGAHLDLMTGLLISEVASNV